MPRVMYPRKTSCVWMTTTTTTGRPEAATSLPRNAAVVPSPAQSQAQGTVCSAPCASAGLSKAQCRSTWTGAGEVRLGQQSLRTSLRLPYHQGPSLRAGRRALGRALPMSPGPPMQHPLGMLKPVARARMRPPVHPSPCSRPEAVAVVAPPQLPRRRPGQHQEPGQQSPQLQWKGHLPLPPPPPPPRPASPWLRFHCLGAVAVQESPKAPRPQACPTQPSLLLSWHALQPSVIW